MVSVGKNNLEKEALKRFDSATLRKEKQYDLKFDDKIVSKSM